MTATSDNSVMMTATGGDIVMMPIIAVTVSLTITAAPMSVIATNHQRPQPDRPA